MSHSSQRISSVLGRPRVARHWQGNAPNIFSGRTKKRLLGAAALALPIAWIALGIADHSELTFVTWLYSPGLPLVFDIPQLSFIVIRPLAALAVVAMIALAIDFLYYTLLIYAGLLLWSGQ